jgi:hypothetical protein
MEKPCGRFSSIQAAIPFGQGQFKGSLAAHTFVPGAGIEGNAAADLGNGEGNRADTSIERFGFEAVGVSGAGVGAFVGLRLEDLGAFLRHSFIDEQTKSLGEASGAFFSEQLQDGVQ